jgi:tetratricopeptide (TPR) repeat protein
MATLFQAQSQYLEAIENYQKTLDIRLEFLGKKHIAVAEVYGGLGEVYMSLDRYDSAAYFFHESVKASALDFDSQELRMNPKPHDALEKTLLMKYLRLKAEALVLLKREADALDCYAAASSNAEYVIHGTRSEGDKLLIAEMAFYTCSPLFPKAQFAKN